MKPFFGMRLERERNRTRRSSYLSRNGVLMLSITNTSKHLRVSKFRLLKLLEAHEIVPTPKGNKKLLSESQIAQLRNILDESKEQTELFASTESNHSSSSRVDKNDPMLQQLLSSKEAEIKFLKEQLEQEKKDRREIEQGIMSIQASMMRFQNLLESPVVERKSFFQRMFSRA
jgi:hypothetical protein